MAQSKRELIAKNIEFELKQIDDPKPIFVTREPIQVSELSDKQFPCVVIRTAGEAREDITMSTSTNRRSGTITYELECFTRKLPVDTSMNEFAEAIEEKLSTDRTRDGNCKLAQMISMEVDTDTVTPYGRFTMTYEAFYDYLKGDV